MRYRDVPHWDHLVDPLEIPGRSKPAMKRGRVERRERADHVRPETKVTLAPVGSLADRQAEELDRLLEALARIRAARV
jgi:hypothetical protein